MEDIHFEPLGNFPADAVDRAKNAATHEIMQFVVALWSGRREGDNIKPLKMGSGTLVTAGEFYGILTAHHVSQLWDETLPLCVNIADHDHQFYVEAQFVQHIVVGSYSSEHDEKGPDLAIFRITDPQKIATIKSKKTFLRLDTRSADGILGWPLADMQCFVVGFPSLLDIPPDPESGLGFGETAFHAQAQFLRIWEAGGFDYLEVDIASGETPFPIHYGGVSGGGIWIFMLAVKDSANRNDVSYNSPVLIGVVYFQQAWENNRRILRGHGPRSVYERVCEVLRTPG